MKTQQETRTGSDADGDMAEVKQAFTALYEEMLPWITRTAYASRLPDPDDVIGEVGEQLWREFPKRYRVNRENQAAGLPPQYNLAAFAAELTNHRIIDHKRKLGLAHRNRRGKFVEATFGDEPVRMKKTDDPRRWEVPLSGVHDVAAPDDYDPAIAYERKEQIAEQGGAGREGQLAVMREILAQFANEEPHLSAAIDTFLRELPDSQAARELGVNRFALYRLRRSAVRRIREYFSERGFDMPTSQPPTLTWPDSLFTNRQ